MYFMKKIKAASVLPIMVFCILCGVFGFTFSDVKSAKADCLMPFYDLRPEYLVLRAQFYTTYSASTEERKTNINLAAKSLDNTFIDIGAEFSFNRTVGERTVKRGYKAAKIIVGGKFVDGIGGGVCQVSTTLYNAALLGGLEITEYHPHSLPVSYIAPSFDAMVNSGNADLRFINNTHNPVILKTGADGNRLTVSIYGEPMKEKYTRKSVVKEYIPAPEPQRIAAKTGEYPDLYEGEIKVLNYGKQGLKSEGYIIVSKDGKILSYNKIRNDKYNAVQGIIIEGCEKKPQPEIIPDYDNIPDHGGIPDIDGDFTQSRTGFICFDP